MVEEALAQEWLSQSRVSSAGKCLFQYQLVHVEKLVRRWNPAPLRRGTLVHSGFEAALLWDWAARHLGGFGDPLYPMQATADHPTARAEHLADMLAIGEEAIRAKQAEWMADPRISPAVDEFMQETAERLVDDAVKVFRRSFTALGVHTGEWETVAAPNGKPFIEYQMDIPFEGWAGFRGTLDWVAKDKRGHVWLWDFKTRKVLQAPEYDQHQIQAPCYQHMMKEQLGVELVGTVTYQIRAAIRKTPKRNKTKPKDATVFPMSRAAITTDWPTYRQALLDAELDPDDYLDMKAKLPGSFDRVEKYYRGPHEVATVWETVLEVVDTIEDAHRLQRFPRNMSPFTCRGCSHRTYCEADIRDEDTDVLRETDYMVEGEDPRYPSLEIINEEHEY